MNTLTKTIAALGDSIMKGVLYNPEARSLRERYVVSDSPIPLRCSRYLGVEVLNFGRFGSTVVQGAEQVQRHIQDISNSKYTLLEFGGNDSDYDWGAIARTPDKRHYPRTPLEIYKDTYSYIIKQVREAGSEPVLLSLPPLDADRYFRFFTATMSPEETGNILKWLGGNTSTISMGHELFNLETMKLAHAEGVNIIDITGIFLAEHEMGRLFCDDGIHPNEQGQALIADTIVRHFSAAA